MKKKNFCTVLALAFFIMSAVRVSAQVTIGDNKTPETFSQLEIVSGNKTGLRLPQITTTAQRDAMITGHESDESAKGLQIFNLESGCVETWNGTKWIQWCDDATTPGTSATATNASNNPVLNINTEINPPIVTHSTTGATGIGTPSGLPSGVTVSWVGGEIIISGTPTESGTFEYSIPLIGGNGTETATGTITVKNCTGAPATPDAISGIPAAAINFGATFTATITAVTGATSYAWTLPSGLTGTSTTNSITITGATAGTYAAGTISVIASNECGNSSSRASTTAVTVNSCSVAPGTPGTISGIPSSAINLNATFTATITAITGATSYAWTLPSGLTGTSTTNSITITGATAGNYAAGTISVVASNDCGSSSSRASTTAVTVRSCTGAPATPGAISGIPSVEILNATFTASITAVSGATSYIWTLPIGLTGSSTTTSITITGATVGTYAAGTIKVAAVNDCGTSATSNNTTEVTVISGGAVKTTNGGWLVFMNYNLGAATNVQTMSPAQQAAHGTPADNYGDLFQWGRVADGHEKRNPLSPTVSSQATEFDDSGQATASTHKGYFVLQSNWRSNDNSLWDFTIYPANNPCPAGWRVPTTAELQSIFNGNTATISSIPTAGQSMTSGNYIKWNNSGTLGLLVYPNTTGTGEPTLFLPVTGQRQYGGAGAIVNLTSQGTYWSSSSIGMSTDAYDMEFSNGMVQQGISFRKGYGRAVRCVAE